MSMKDGEEEREREKKEKEKKKRNKMFPTRTIPLTLQKETPLLF